MSQNLHASAAQLQISEKVDVRDSTGKFILSTIKAKNGSNLKIHYDAWNDKWDEWIDYNTNPNRFANAGSISQRPAHRFRDLKKGDFIDINPTLQHPGWKMGEIQALDNQSGQITVSYDHYGIRYQYWAHLDNELEIAEFTLKTLDQNDYTNNQSQNKKERFIQKLLDMGFAKDDIERALEVYCRIVQSNHTVEMILSIVTDLQNEDTVTVKVENEYVNRKRNRTYNCNDNNQNNDMQESSCEAEPPLKKIRFSNQMQDVKTGDGLSAKQSEFKLFFYSMMNGGKSDEYYRKLMENGMDDIEMMMYLDESTLVNDCDMNGVHASMFLSKIRVFNQSYHVFKDWLVDGLEMEEYLLSFMNNGILTMNIFYKNLKNVKDVMGIIGFDNENDAQMIIDQLPKNKRKS